jgi:hypothetical protein
MAKKTPQIQPKTSAYLRVSTLDQDIEKNKADILHFANHHDLGKVQFIEEYNAPITLDQAIRF